MTTHPEECVDSWATDLTGDEQIATAQSRNNHNLFCRERKDKKKDSPDLAISPPLVKKGNETEVYGNSPPEKIALAAYCPITSVGCPGEKQARIVAKGKISEHRRTLIERTWLYRELAIGDVVGCVVRVGGFVRSRSRQLS